MFKEDKGILYGRINAEQGKVPEMEDDTITPNRKWIETVAENIREKITNVEEITINEEKPYKTIKKKSAPRIDLIQNF